MERPTSIRELVHQEMKSLGVDDSPIETLLIRDGRYCGHRYETSALTAIWFHEEDQLKFYTPDGRTLKSMSTLHENEQRKAA